MKQTTSRCYAYTRVSTVKQGEGVSLEAQREAIEVYAAKHQIDIIEWLEEKQTAAKQGRAVFSELVRNLKAGNADGFVIHRIDRSARNLKDWATIGDLSDMGIEVHFAAESLDFTSRGGRLAADVQAVVAADFIRNLKIETRKGLLGRLKQGLYPWPAPTGYLNNGKGEVKTFDPRNAQLVRELFKEYLSGNWSIRTLHIEMRRRGMRSSKGRPISRRNVESILKNPFYCGLMIYAPTGEVFPGKHKPMISVRDFERIRDIRAGRHVKKTTRRNHTFRRLFRCARCSGLLTGERQKSYVYYRCHQSGCRTSTLREDLLDATLRRAMSELQLTSDTDRQVEQHSSQWAEPQSSEEQLRALKLRMSDAEARLSRLADLLLDAAIDRETHDKKRISLQFEVAKLRSDIADYAKKDASTEDREKFFELMKNVAGLYQIADEPDKRVIVEMCFSNRTWNGEKLELQPSNLVMAAQNGDYDPNGCPYRDTIRTLAAKMDLLVGTQTGLLLELLSCSEIVSVLANIDADRATKQDIG